MDQIGPELDTVDFDFDFDSEPAEGLQALKHILDSTKGKRITLRDIHMWAAQGIAQTCYLTYADMESGLGPDEVLMAVDVDGDKGSFWNFWWSDSNRAHRDWLKTKVISEIKNPEDRNKALPTTPSPTTATNVGNIPWIQSLLEWQEAGGGGDGWKAKWLGKPPGLQDIRAKRRKWKNPPGRYAANMFWGEGRDYISRQPKYLLRPEVCY